MRCERDACRGTTIVDLRYVTNSCNNRSSCETQYVPELCILCEDPVYHLFSLLPCAAEDLLDGKFEVFLKVLHGQNLLQNGLWNPPFFNQQVSVLRLFNAQL